MESPPPPPRIKFMKGKMEGTKQIFFFYIKAQLSVTNVTSQREERQAGLKKKKMKILIKSASTYFFDWQLSPVDNLYELE